MGCLGTLPFIVSSAQVMSFSDAQLTRGSRFAWHAVLGSHPVPEFIGPATTQISMKIRFQTELGAPPLVYSEWLYSLTLPGEEHILCLGSDYIGKVVIETYTEERRVYGAYGLCTLADISLTLKTATPAQTIASAISSVTGLL